MVGIILQAALGELNLVQAVILVFLLLVVVLIVFLLMLLLVRLGWISHTVLVQNKTAVPMDITEGTLDYTPLLGRTGIATTQLRPIGKALIDDEEYDVIAFNGMMFEKDTKVVVTKVEGVKIIVKEIKEKKE
ncbi:MAG: NfeD family protein [Firmicutes bacterium]|nr:NfeD family protein [Bacillota bacterium]